MSEHEWIACALSPAEVVKMGAERHVAFEGDASSRPIRLEEPHSATMGMQDWKGPESRTSS